MRIGRLLLAVFLMAGSASGQWEILPSGSTADLRGIDALGKGVAWASGTQGTVLRTTNDGKSWQRCAVPAGAEQLDFRGVQAFDASTAIVMSSGKGTLSRVYKTTDGCRTWVHLFTNPDADGFWDAIQFTDQKSGCILGDRVNGSMSVWYSRDGGKAWALNRLEGGLEASADTGAFAASNSALMVNDRLFVSAFVTGGTQPYLYWRPIEVALKPSAWRQSLYWSKVEIPLAKGATAGAFSIAHTGDFELFDQTRPALFTRLVIVGGDYKKPEETVGTAAFSVDEGKDWNAARTPPHGFRSAVAYDAKAKVWITVGPNGTDVSSDDGRDWRALRPNPAVHEPEDSDQHWNALSLPFVVGPHGRIGRLRVGAVK